MHDSELLQYAQEHEIGVGGDLSKNVDFVLVYALYNVRRDRKDSNSTHDVFGLEGMKDITRVLEDIMKPVALRNVFDFSLQLHF